MEVTNVLDTHEIESNAKLYVLPKTVVSVTVTVNREIKYPGPYAKFSGKFLGTNNIINKKSVKWEISNLSINTHEIEDKRHFYVLQEDNKSQFSFSSLIEKKLIFPIDGISENSVNQSNPNTKETNSDELFSDFFMKDNLVEREKTVYETVNNDSTSYTVLKKKKLYSSRTIEEKAENAADLLVRLRKRRFKLFASIEKNSIGSQVRQYAKEYPDGKALETMLKELENLENEIIAFFKGKIITEEFTYNYEYIPAKASGKYKLLNFSDKKGIFPPETESDNEFTIRYNLEHNTSELGKLVNKKDDITYYSHVVRVPDYANFIIDKDDEFQVSKRLKIFQFGSLVSVRLVH